MSELKVNKNSPATGTAFTLGDSGDTFTVPSGATITNSGTATGFGGGKILQIQTTRWTGQTTTNTASYTATPLSGYQVSITPSATTSNVLIMGVLNYSTNNETDHMYGKMYRDSTQINMGVTMGSRDIGMWNMKLGTNLGNSNPEPILYYDTEISTTSAVTYSIQIKMANTSIHAYFNYDGTSDAASKMTYASTLMAIEMAPN